MNRREIRICIATAVSCVELVFLVLMYLAPDEPVTKHATWVEYGVYWPMAIFCVIGMACVPFIAWILALMKESR